MGVHIIGGGIIGLCSAYFLQEMGEEVTIIDKGDLSAGCSHGNAGMIVPSHFIPLAAPGVIQKGIRWMFNASSPFYIRPAFDKDLIRWIWKFYKSCNKNHVDNSMKLLLDAHQISVELYSQLSETLNTSGDQLPDSTFGFQKKGLMLLFKDEKTRKEELEIAEMAEKLGMKARKLDPEQIQILQPNCAIEALGGVYYPGDAHLNPGLLMHRLTNYLKTKGVQFILSEEIIGFRQSNGRIESVRTINQEIEVDRILIAAGSWSGTLLKKMDKYLPMQDGKGYSMLYTGFKNIPSVPTILASEKVSVTPFGSSFRIGGTLEISRLSHKINTKRLEGIVRGFKQYFPEISIELPDISEVWHGFRPLSPDGIPYIGKLGGVSNCYINTGHAMMGMSLGPASGLLISQIMNDELPVLPVQLFNPDRF